MIEYANQRVPKKNPERTQIWENTFYTMFPGKKNFKQKDKNNKKARLLKEKIFNYGIQLNEIIEDLRLKIKAITNRVKSYNKKRKTKTQNYLFKENPKKFFMENCKK